MSEIQVEQTATPYQTSGQPADSGESSLIDLLPQPPGGALDTLAALEELLVRMQVQDRGQARDENRIEEQRIEQAGAHHVQAILDEGEAMFRQGLISGLGQAVGGGLSAYGGASSLTLSDSNAAGLNAQEYSGLGSLFEGLGTAGASFAGSDANDAQAEGAEAQTEQEAAERRASQAASEMQSASDDLRALLGRFQAIHDAELAAQNAAVFMA